MVDIVYGYVRVSSVKQESGFGPEIQANAIKKYCSEKGLPEPTFVHDSETGKNNDRPGIMLIYENAKEHVKNGDTPHCVMYRMDRLSRLLIYIDQRIIEAGKIGLTLHSCQPGEESYFDQELFDDPDAKLIRHIMSAVIEHDRDIIQKRMDGGLERLNAKGGYTGGGVPFGYKIVNKDIAVNEEYRPAIQRIFKRIDAGTTLENVAKEMLSAFPGMKKWCPQTIHKIVKRRRMYEEGIYKGRLGGETKRPELIMIQNET